MQKEASNSAAVNTKRLDGRILFSIVAMGVLKQKIVYVTNCTA